MNLLFSSDWQAQETNLDFCEAAFGELQAQARRLKPEAIILCGDLKEAYSPVSVRVVKWWIRAITTLTRQYRVICMLGNHDRVSQTRTSTHWLDVMRAAGAEIVSKPKVKTVGECVIGFLPFTADKEKEKQWAADLAKQADAGRSILVFHCEVTGSIMGGKGITPEDLHAAAWDVCIGGHVHAQLFIKPNIYYVGSPFCHSWGEVNQSHGNLVVEA